MPEPVAGDRRYLPGLDGLRGIAVAAVVAYHLGLDATPGGLLGVSVFFTLSGYLITDLILLQRDRGTFGLRRFWLARARRLLPALVVCLGVVSTWVVVFGPEQTATFRTSVLTALGYVNNWWLIARDASYFEQFEAPGPLNHLWSLAIEEQFYVVWPVIVALTVVGARRVGWTTRRALVAVCLTLAAASWLAMIVLYDPSGDPSRVYYGTDTRAMELLVGAALAALWPSTRLRHDVTASARTTIEVVGVVGVAVIAVLVATVDDLAPFLYRFGFAISSVAVAAAVASVVHPASRLGAVVGCLPLRWIGVRSYAIYLWHMPIIALTTPEGTEPSALRMSLQVAAAVAASALSWSLVEDPIRRRGLLAWIRSLGPSSGASRAGAVGAAAGAVVIVAGAVSLTSLEPEAVPAATFTGSVQEVAVDSATGGPISAEEYAARLEPVPLDEPCRSVVHVGDSTSLGLVSSAYLPFEGDRISAQYQRVGVTTQHYEIAGARSILEPFRDSPSASEAARARAADGYRGCWVFALGTTDSANLAAGSRGSPTTRIDTMMEIADGAPVLWVNVRTIETDGAWSNENMIPFNEALAAACARYPNLRIYDFASDTKDEWFDTDRTHNNTRGYIARSRGIADALALAFPIRDGSCVVDPGAVATCIDSEHGRSCSGTTTSAPPESTPPTSP